MNTNQIWSQNKIMVKKLIFKYLRWLLILNLIMVIILIINTVIIMFIKLN